MRWMLAGCWTLVVVSLSAAHDRSHRVTQKPRFFGLTTGRNAYVYCMSSRPQVPATATWYKAARHDAPWRERKPVEAGKRFVFRRKAAVHDALLIIGNLQPEDSGVYFCKVNGTPGSGTEIQAARLIDRSVAVYHSQLKDGLMVLQGVILAACVAALLMRQRTQREKTDSIYEEPETDHIYEGLAIESCEGGLYEDLSAYAQPEHTEAPWE